ncbi:MAG: PhnA domain-containing protein [Planctomycetota bacterium]
MSTVDTLKRRSKVCELCASDHDLRASEVPPQAESDPSRQVLVCGTCADQIADPSTMDANHWRCLNDSMWSETAAVQVLAYRLLQRLSNEAWARDLRDMLYLDETNQAWADAVGDPEATAAIVHKDSNGSTLAAGDSVVLIKDLVVKGGGFTAKRGTAVRNIALVPENPEHIEGRVSGQKIVILTQFVKKSG